MNISFCCSTQIHAKKFTFSLRKCLEEFYKVESRRPPTIFFNNRHGTLHIFYYYTHITAHRSLVLFSQKFLSNFYSITAIAMRTQRISGDFFMRRCSHRFMNIRCVSFEQCFFIQNCVKNAKCCVTNLNFSMHLRYGFVYCS